MNVNNLAVSGNVKTVKTGNTEYVSEPKSKENIKESPGSGGFLTSKVN